MFHTRLKRFHNCNRKNKYVLARSDNNNDRCTVRYTVLHEYTSSTLVRGPLSHGRRGVKFLDYNGTVSYEGTQPLQKGSVKAGRRMVREVNIGMSYPNGRKEFSNDNSISGRGAAINDPGIMMSPAPACDPTIPNYKGGAERSEYALPAALAAGGIPSIAVLDENAVYEHYMRRLNRVWMKRIKVCTRCMRVVFANAILAFSCCFTLCPAAILLGTGRVHHVPVSSRLQLGQRAAPCKHLTRGVTNMFRNLFERHAAPIIIIHGVYMCIHIYQATREKAGIDPNHQHSSPHFRKLHARPTSVPQFIREMDPVVHPRRRRSPCSGVDPEVSQVGNKVLITKGRPANLFLETCA